MDLIISILSFVLALGILVTVHEFGHFWVARQSGVKVLRFSVGFGKPIYRFYRNNDPTEYVIAAIPLGGYVKMLDEREGEVSQEDLPQAFNRQSLKARTAIVFAGPLFNFVFAFFAFWLVLMIGEAGLRTIVGEVAPESLAAQAGIHTGDEIVQIGSVQTPIWNVAMGQIISQAMDDGELSLRVRTSGGIESDRLIQFGTTDRLEPPAIIQKLGIQPWQPILEPVLDQVIAGGAADQAGLLAGDRILLVDGQSVNNWRDWVAYLQSKPGQRLSVLIERQGNKQELLLVPEAVVVDGTTIGRIGAMVAVPESVASGMQGIYQLNPLSAIPAALNSTWHYSVLTLKMVGRLLVGTASIENLSGPISLAQFAGQSASSGLVTFLKFLAFVSISLGVINLLPIPMLDGGHLLFYFIEFIKGGPVPEAVQEMGMRLGLAVLVFVMGLAFFVDLGRLF